MSVTINGTTLNTTSCVTYNGNNITTIWACDTSNATCCLAWSSMPYMTFTKSGNYITDLQISGALDKDLTISRVSCYNQTLIGATYYNTKYCTYSARCTGMTTSLNMTYSRCDGLKHRLLYGNAFTNFAFEDYDDGDYTFALLHPGQVCVNLTYDTNDLCCTYVLPLYKATCIEIPDYIACTYNNGSQLVISNGSCNLNSYMCNGLFSGETNLGSSAFTCCDWVPNGLSNKSWVCVYDTACSANMFAYYASSSLCIPTACKLYPNNMQDCVLESDGLLTIKFDCIWVHRIN